MKSIKLILLLLLANFCFGQPSSGDIDSLRSVASSNIPDSVKFNTYIDLMFLTTDTSEVKSILDKSFTMLENSDSRQKMLYRLPELALKLRRADDLQKRKIVLEELSNKLLDTDSTLTIANFNFEYGIVQHRLGQLNKAVFYYDQAEDLFEKINDKAGVAKCLSARSIVVFHLGDTQNALEANIKCIEIFKSLDKVRDVMIMRYNLCDIYMKLGDVSKAINELEIGKRVAERIGDERMIVFMLSKLGSIYNSQGKYEIAREYLEESLEKSLLQGQKTAIAEAYVSLADNALDLQSNDLALDYYHKSLKIYEEIGDMGSITKRLYSLGNYYLKRNNEDSALLYINKGFEIGRKAKFVSDHLEQLGKLGSWFLDKGDIPTALDQYFEGMQLAEEAVDSVNISRFYLEIAKVYQAMQNDSLTNVYYDQSLEISRQISHMVGIANVKNAKARQLLKNSALKEALNLAYEAEALIKSSGDSCRLSDSYLNLGNIFLQTDMNDSSLYYLSKSLKTASRCNVTNVLASTLNSLAYLYEKLGDKKQAIANYEKALALGEKETFRNVIITASQQLHRLYYEAGNTDQAYPYLMIYQNNKDQVFNAEVTREVTRKELAYQYEKERAAKEVSQQKAQLEKDQKIQNLRWITFTAIGSFLAMLLVAFAYYRNYRNKQKANQLLSIRNDAIEKQRQKLQELDLSKSRFFANISHELRTPLTLISGPLEELADYQKYDERAVQLMLRNTKKLKGLVNDILDLSKLESFKLKISYHPVDVRSFISRISSNYESMAQRLEIDYSYSVGKSVADWLMLDGKRVEKILNNLLSNAIKYTGAGGKIVLKLIREDEQLVIQVADTGQGIPESDLPHIFERYFQSKQPDTPIQGGTGIGLALANELAILMDGELKVESKVGAGSTFTCILPYKIAVDPGVKLQDFVKLDAKDAPVFDKKAFEIDNSHVSVSGRPKVLIVEDNEDMQIYISNLLDSAYEVSLADNGKKALDFLNKEKVDLIITDAMMPEMDGFSFIEHLKESESLRPVPVIMLTALNFENSKLKALAMGVDDYLTKPFSATELLARVQNLIARYEVRKSVVLEESSEPDAVRAGDDNLLAAIYTSDMEWLKNVELHIIEEIENPDFNIASLADDFHLSRRQFQRRIKKLTGMSPKQYQMEIGLQKARRLLEDATYENVTAVGYAVGVNNASRFSQMYYQRFGKKPGDYFSHGVEV